MEISKSVKFTFDGVNYDTEEEALVAKILWTLGIGGAILKEYDLERVTQNLKTNARTLSVDCGKLDSPKART